MVNGFYVDVGAGHTEVDSVTKFFYENGWAGVNVEPNPELFESLRDRTRDVNLQIALGAECSTSEFTVVKGTGLSTFVTGNLDNAQERRETETIFVEVRTLRDVWNDFVPKGQEVHFLKIDAEGFEKEVILGGSWQKQRPWIVLVEATVPGTQRLSFAKWERTLLDNNYLFAFFDGLNRYYLADEHSSRFGHFGSPPNVFDGFVKNSEVQAQIRIKALEASLELERAQARNLKAVLANLHGHASQLQGRVLEAEARSGEIFDILDSVVKSKTWKITAPFRKLPRLRTAPKALIVCGYRLYLRSGFIRTLASATVLRSPKLTALLLRYMNPGHQSQVGKISTAELGQQEDYFRQLLTTSIEVVRQQQTGHHETGY